MNKKINQNPSKRQQHISDYFNDVEPFSEEHQNDLEKFSRFLESMQNSQKNNADRRATTELKLILHSFNQYKNDNNLLLNENEKNEISAITGSGFTPVVKKRIMEDIIYKIKQRYQNTKKIKLEQLTLDKEINELKSSKSRVIRWIELTKFALDYQTITLFSHRLKDRTLSLIREKVIEWHKILHKNIKPILDKQYYALSTLEYNSLEIILRLEKPLRDIQNIMWNPSYDSNQISLQLDSFAGIYLTILKNRNYAENAIKKAFKKKKPTHGLQGTLKKFLDQPLYNNKPVQWSQYDMMENSIRGLLFSYYSAREGRIIRTANQILYLIAVDGKLDGTKKHLTQEAGKLEKMKRVQENTDEKQIIDKYNELERIVDYYLKNGHGIEDKIYKIEAKTQYPSWISENKNKPLLRVKRLVEGFITYFADLINDKDNFILLYDNNEYRDYFQIEKEITNISSEYNMVDFEMVGTKVKQLINLSIPSDTTAKQFIFSLTKFNIPKSAIKAEFNFAKAVLQKIVNKSYQLAQKLNELITFYYNHKEIIHPDIIRNFDFFSNAVIKKTKNNKSEIILQKKIITLRDFLEASCSLAFFIVQELNNTYIEEIIKEKNSFKLKIDQMLSKQLVTDKLDNGIITPDLQDLGTNEELLQEIDQIYKDPLTGIWRQSYLEDQIIPKLYDDKKNYEFDTPRFVFCFEINGLKMFNNDYGHDTGDKLLIEVSKKIAEHVYKPNIHRDDVVIKYEGGIIIGYINNTTLTSAADIMLTIVRDIDKVLFKNDEIDIDQIPVNAGIYQERKRTNVYENIRIAKKIMQTGIIYGQNSINFPKNVNQIIRKADFNRFGELEKNIITTLK